MKPVHRTELAPVLVLHAPDPSGVFQFPRFAVHCLLCLKGSSPITFSPLPRLPLTYLLSLIFHVIFPRPLRLDRPPHSQGTSFASRLSFSCDDCERSLLPITPEVLKGQGLRVFDSTLYLQTMGGGVQ